MTANPGTKPVLRRLALGGPQTILVATNHLPQEFAAPWECCVWVADTIHIKHFRDGGYRYDADSECDKLTTDPPEWQPQGKLPARRHNI